MSLELRGATKRYPNGAVGALDVDLAVPHGTFTALYGPSGSGKTSQLHMLGLLQRPDSGEIWIEGERVDQLSERNAASLRRSKIGFVFQSAMLLRLLSARENVDVSLRLAGERGSSAREKVEQALANVGMADRMDHRPDELSGGEQQRVAIARAMVHSPQYLLADEPTGELDVASGASILAILKDVAQRGTTVVMATHDPASIDYVTKAYFVESGNLTEPSRSDLTAWLTEGTPF